MNNATMAQLVEHILGKDEVIGSIPISSSKKRQAFPVVFYPLRKAMAYHHTNVCISPPKVYIISQGLYFFAMMIYKTTS